MYTLHIEHPISDFALWAGAFARFAPLRRSAGVRGAAVRRPVDDAHFVVIDLDFDTVDDATRFQEILRSRIWADPVSSPALDGDPVTRILATEDMPDPTPR